MLSFPKIKISRLSFWYHVQVNNLIYPMCHKLILDLHRLLEGKAVLAPRFTVLEDNGDAEGAHLILFPIAEDDGDRLHRRRRFDIFRFFYVPIQPKSSTLDAHGRLLPVKVYYTRHTYAPVGV